MQYLKNKSHEKWKKNRESCLRECAVFPEFHMARSNIEMQRKQNRDGALKSYKSSYIVAWNKGGGHETEVFI